MTKTMIPVAALGALLGACTDVPNLAPDTCGNRVIDKAEDCDGFSGMGESTACGAPETSNGCFFICGEQADGALLECPEGWGCGLDRRCRQPSGSFVEAGAPFRFQTDAVVLGDVDGDGYPDLVGQQGAQLSIRFGAESGDFPLERSTPVPEPLGALAFGLFDDDGLLDMVVPIAGGLITLVGRASRDLEPVTYSSLDLENTERGVRALILEAFPDDQNSEILAIIDSGMRFFENSSNAFVPFPDENGPLESLVDEIGVGDVIPEAGDEFAIAFEGGNTVYLCRAGISDNDQRTLQPLCDPIATSSSPIHSFGTRLADVDGDGDLDLLVAVTGDTSEQVNVAVAQQNAGVFDGSSLGAVFPERQEGAFDFCEGQKDAIRSNPWPLAASDFNRDGRADYVFVDSIAIARGGSIPGLPDRMSEVACISSGRWQAATVTDINGDGWPDVAVSFAGIEGIDFYINAGDEAGGELFNKFHVNTGKPPIALRTGDFDGDRVQDIAYYESNRDGASDRVAVIFGSTSGGPAAPVFMGAFDGIEVFEPIFSPFESLNGRDRISDLVVVSLPPGTEATEPPPAIRRVATILQGDSSRRMLSPMFLVNGDGNAEQPIGALFGHFLAEEGEVQQARDLVAISSNSVPGSGEIPTSNPQLWLLSGIDGSGALQVPIEPVAVLPSSLDSFDYTCALWAAGDLDPLDDDGLDEVVGIDRSVGCRDSDGVAQPSRMIVANPADLAREDNVATEIPAFTLGDSYAFARSLVLRDLDRDGRQDVLVGFAGLNGDKTAVVAFWNQDGAFSSDNQTTFQAPNNGAVVDTVPVQMLGDGTPEVLILTSDGVYAARLDPQTRQYQALDTPVLALRSGAVGEDGRMRVADVDGDGLDDLVLILGGDVQVALQGSRAPLGSATTAAAVSGIVPGTIDHTAAAAREGGE